MKVVSLIACFLLSHSEGAFENIATDLQVLQNSTRPTPRIVNGQSALPTQFPHQALVFINTQQGSFQCGGSVISQLWVLSAAHCVIGVRSAQILLGSISRNSMPIQRNAVQVIRMSSYNSVTLKDDISLIKVGNPIPFSSNVQPIQLPAKSQASDSYLNSILIVSGFGLTTANQVSSTLQFANVTGISNSECRGIYGTLISASILCTRGYPNTNQGSCQGDSGGPLIKVGNTSIIVGIVSFGAAESCTAGYPQGFTRVGSYLNWISSLTGINLRI